MICANSIPAIVGFALVSIAAISIAIGLPYFWNYPDKMAEFNRRNVPAPNFSICDDACVGEIGRLQSASTGYFNMGILLGLAGSVLLAFKFKAASGIVLLSLGGLFLYEFLADSALCEFPDDEGLWTPPSPCGIDDYSIPAIFFVVGGILIRYSFKKGKKQTTPIP